MPTPNLAALRAGTPPRAFPAALLAGAAIAAAAILFSGPAIVQDPEYHRFADARAFAGVPNAANVLSNVAFLAAGLLGLAVVRRHGHRLLDARERAPWIALFGGTVVVAAGSAAYHLHPCNATLVLDRLPMSVAFMGLLAAMIAERVDVRAGARLLVPLAAAGAASVLWWGAVEWLHAASLARSAGDLRPYLLVQAFSLASVPLLLAAGAPRYTGARWLLGALALYGAAKLAELGDRAVWSATAHVSSGHTLKHLLAAAGIALLAAMLARRRPLAARAT